MNAISQSFIKSPFFAVVGASNSPEKFGNRILRWYQSNGLDVTPVNPKEPEVETIKAVKTIEELPFPEQTSLSIVTPPNVTLQVLQRATQLGIKYIWIQPGAEDEKVKEFVHQYQQQSSNTAVHGEGIILGGLCLLVEGPQLLKNYRNGGKL